MALSWQGHLYCDHHRHAVQVVTHQASNLSSDITVSRTVLKKKTHQRCIANTSTSTAMCNEQQERLLHVILICFLVRKYKSTPSPYLVLRMGGIDSMTMTRRAIAGSVVVHNDSVSPIPMTYSEKGCICFIETTHVFLVTYYGPPSRVVTTDRWQAW